MARTRGVVVQISAEENTGRAFSAVNEQIANLKAQVANLRSQLATAGGGFAELGAQGERFGKGMYAQMTYASSAVREFEGTLPIRAVERFLTETLGLGPALGAIFPLVGAIAFGSIIIRDIADLVKMQEAARQLASAINAAFDEAIAKAREHADALAVSNDRLEEQIAKLEHKPSGNGLAAGADEASVEFDKLAGSIHAAADEAEKLFDDKTKVTMFDRVFNGTKSNEGVKDEVTAAMKQADDLQNQYGEVASQAAASGESKDRIDQDIAQNMLARVQGVYSALDKKLNDQLKTALDQQYDDKHLGGDGSHYQPLINSLQGALGLSQQQQRTIGEQYRQSQLAPVVAQDHGDTTPKVKDDGQKLLDAQRNLEEALRKQHQQAEASLAAVAKLESQAELAQLDQKHKQQLVSDVDYYAQRTAIQKRALEQEQAANYQQQGALRNEITDRFAGLSQDTDPAKRMADEAKIVELQTQLATLEDKRLGIAQQIAKVETEGATQAFEVTKKAEDAARNLAAQLEGERGGSTAARLAKLRDEYDDKRRAMAPAGAVALSNLDSQQAVDEAKIGVEGAQQDSSASVAGIGAKRSAVAHAVATGAMSEQAAQQARIQLDREEAAALEPVLQAYEALAATGDQAAAGKVQELSEKIAELRTPVSQVAEEIRTQLNGALEQLFENLGKGKSAWQDFAKALQSMALKDTYQQFLQPLVQTALGHVIPNGGGPGRAPGAAAIPGASGGGSWLSSLVPGLAKALPSAAGARSGSGVTVQIINQTSSPAQGTASQQTAQDGSAMTEMLRPQVIQIMLEDLDRGGSFAQALSGLGGLAAG